MLAALRLAHNAARGNFATPSASTLFRLSPWLLLGGRLTSLPPFQPPLPHSPVSWARTSHSPANILYSRITVNSRVNPPSSCSVPILEPLREGEVFAVSTSDVALRNFDEAAKLLVLEAAR